MLFLVLFLFLSLTYNVSFFSNGKLNSNSKICFLCVIYINYNCKSIVVFFALFYSILRNEHFNHLEASFSRGTHSC